ncbi:DUF4367 domain-containing protein [bacterium]|nr:DUF4367 domain-containing protein [bacterium]MDY4502784.1 DUF4367 domain-containing protein [Bariatricus sp.]
MKNEQEKLEDFLKSELMKEGEEILAEIEADESLEDISLPEEMDEGLWEKMKKRQAEKAAYEALSEKDKEALRLGREMMMLNGDDAGKGEGQDEKNAVGKRDAESAVENDGAKVVKYSGKRKKRVYFLVAAVAVLALAAGMTSIGGAPFVAKIRKQLIGEREMVKVNSEREGEEDRIATDSTESKAWQDIKETLGIEPVRFWYRPEGMLMLEYEIDKELEDVCLIYTCNEGNLEYQLWANFRDKSIGYNVEDTLLCEETLLVSGVEINIKTFQIEETKIKEYTAQFQYNGAYYVLNSNIEKEEFLKIINNLDFL